MSNVLDNPEVRSQFAVLKIEIPSDLLPKLERVIIARGPGGDSGKKEQQLLVKELITRGVIAESRREPFKFAIGNAAVIARSWNGISGGTNPLGTAGGGYDTDTPKAGR